MGIAVAHQTLSVAVVTPNEALTLDQALRTQPITAAWAAFVERRFGSIEPREMADLALLHEDRRDVAPDAYRNLPIDLTVPGGGTTRAARTTAAVA